jgi:hypothetical protein
MDRKTRLTAIQKQLLNDINKSKILDPIDIPDELQISLIDVKKLKEYNDIHKKIVIILTNNNIEPHEIFNMIETYDGKHPIYNKLKNFLILRNICILKKIKGTEKWKANVNKIMDILKTKYKCPKKINMIDILENSVMDLLIKDVKMFDILQCRIELDGSNNLKSLNMNNLEDQKYIVSKLLENGCIKI